MSEGLAGQSVAQGQGNASFTCGHLVGDLRVGQVEIGQMLQPDQVLDDMDAWCTQHHGASGLTDAVKASEIAEREAAVLERAGRLNLNLVEQSFGQQLLRTIIEESKRLQGEARELVAFQGEHGAYGELAARQLAPAAAHAPCMEYVDVFDGVEQGYFDRGVVPVEHSLEGSVTQVNDLLIKTSASVVGEINVPVSHCLMAVEESDYRDLRVVYSHPEALAQCAGFIERLNLEPRPFYDTAGAAKMLARENPRAAAAIASPRTRSHHR